MKKIVFLLLAFTMFQHVSNAQKVYQTRSGKVSFYSDAPLEKIEAVNTQTSAKLATNGQLVFMAAIKGFVFENATMQEHFNENYMQSDKFSKATFFGTISNLKDVNFDKDGTYKVTTTGDLEIHGVKQKVTIPGTITIAGGKVSSKSVFKIKLADYNVKGSLIGEKIAKEVEVKVDCKYD